MRKITGAALTALFFACVAFAHEHTALNGTWTLVPTKSEFAGQAVIQTGTVTINERQGDITVVRSFAYEGANDTFFYRDLTDSQNSATIHSGKDLKSKTKWDHDVPEGDYHPIRIDYRGKLLIDRGRRHVGQRSKAGPQAVHACVRAQVGHAPVTLFG